MDKNIHQLTMFLQEKVTQHSCFDRWSPSDEPTITYNDYEIHVLLNRSRLLPVQWPILSWTKGQEISDSQVSELSVVILGIFQRGNPIEEHELADDIKQEDVDWRLLAWTSIVALSLSFVEMFTSIGCTHVFVYQ